MKNILMIVLALIVSTQSVLAAECECVKDRFNKYDLTHKGNILSSHDSAWGCEVEKRDHTTCQVAAGCSSSSKCECVKGRFNYDLTHNGSILSSHDSAWGCEVEKRDHTTCQAAEGCN